VADKKDVWPDNAKGKFFVDKTCIACDACCIAAPDNFKMNEDSGHAYLSKQPAGAGEEDQCKEAMEGCPVEAIGSDGE
jgi:ferredoxin